MEKGIKVKLTKQFSHVVDALQRCGIVNYKEKVITPTCVLIIDNDETFIYHFKEALEKDGNQVSINSTDLGRRNYICYLLELQGYIEIIGDIEGTEGVTADMLPWQIAQEYVLNKKYTFRNKNEQE